MMFKNNLPCCCWCAPPLPLQLKLLDATSRSSSEDSRAVMAPTRDSVYIVLLVLSTVLNCVSGASCDAAEYYSGISGLENPPSSREEWNQLRADLHQLLQQTHVIIPYTSSSGIDVWDALQILDQDPSNSSCVWLLYANRSEAFVTHGKPSSWNREHIIPRSYGLFDTGPDYSDLHNLRAADASVNSARSNLYFDNCEPSIDVTCHRPAHAEAAPDTSKNSLHFNPSAYRKGDIARSAFYMALRYDGSETDTENITLTECSCIADHSFGNLSTLMKWAEEDLVDEEEMKRNNLTCHMFQQNRNPFVDFPWLMSIFDVRPALYQISAECGANYTFDPHKCYSDTSPAATNGPTPSPSVSFQPTSNYVESSLAVGDVAVITFNSDNPDSFALVALAEVAVGEMIYVTDNGWTSTGFRGYEGVLSFAVQHKMPPGTVLSYESDNPSSWTNQYGHWSTSSAFALSVSGDQLFVYTQSYDDPYFVFGLSNTWSSHESSTTSILPSQLHGTNAYVTLGYFDNAQYAADRIGTKEELLDRISNSSLWMRSSSTRYEIDNNLNFTVLSTSQPHDDEGSGYFLSDASSIVIIVVLAIAVSGLVLFCCARCRTKKHLKATESKDFDGIDIDNVIHAKPSGI